MRYFLPSHSRSMRTFTLDWSGELRPSDRPCSASSMAAEDLALALHAVALDGQVVAAKYHILSRTGNGLAVLRLQYVVCGQHEEAGLGLCLYGKRHMNRHLVAVKVGVERGTSKRVQLDGAALHQHRLECLDAQAVQRRRAVEEYGMLFDYALPVRPRPRA